jgi:hypothetical protein
VGRTYSCWMLNCWCITWPVRFKRLIQPHVSTYARSFSVLQTKLNLLQHVFLIVLWNRCPNLWYIFVYRLISTLCFEELNPLTLILLTWRIWWAPNNARKWQMGFNSAFKGLIKISWDSNYIWMLCISTVTYHWLIHHRLFCVWLENIRKINSLLYKQRQITALTYTAANTCAANCSNRIYKLIKMTSVDPPCFFA